MSGDELAPDEQIPDHEQRRARGVEDSIHCGQIGDGLWSLVLGSWFLVPFGEIPNSKSQTNPKSKGTTD
jgi:hypothetical protein